MNKGEIRTLILEQVDWSPEQSTGFKEKVDRLINRAYQQMVLEAPYLFFEDEVQLYTEPDVTNGSDDQDALFVPSGGYAAYLTHGTVWATSTDSEVDPFVFARTYTNNPSSLTGHPDGVTPWEYSTSAGIVSTPGSFHDEGDDAAEYAFNRLSPWAGRTIEVTTPKDVPGTPSEVKVRREIRDVWREYNASTNKYTDYITVDKPWPLEADQLASKGGLTYRIYTPEYGLPSDTIELRSARIREERGPELKVETQYDMERFDYIDSTGQQSGRPEKIFRGPHKQLQAPTNPPRIDPIETLDPSVRSYMTDDNRLVVTVDSYGLQGWYGPEPQGSWEFCYTYAMGVSDILGGANVETLHKEPRWESAPSPIAAVELDNDNAVILIRPDPGLNHLHNFFNVLRKEFRDSEEMHHHFIADFPTMTADTLDDAGVGGSTDEPAPRTMYRVPIRYTRSGYHIRIYARRVSASRDDRKAALSLSGATIDTGGEAAVMTYARGGTSRGIGSSDLRIREDHTDLGLSDVTYKATGTLYENPLISDSFYLLGVFSPQWDFLSHVHPHSIRSWYDSASGARLPIERVNRDSSHGFIYRGQRPAYNVRLKNTHGYQTVRFHPTPDNRYEIDCRVLRRPQKLTEDSDVPRIHEEACQALIEKCLVYFYELQGSMELSQNAERRYKDALHTLTKRYAVIPRLRPSKKSARVRRPVREVRVRYKE